MESQLDGFLRYLEVERGFSPGTIEAYRLDVGKGLIPFLYERGKFDAAKVTRDDIRHTWISWHMRGATLMPPGHENWRR